MDTYPDITVVKTAKVKKDKNASTVYEVEVTLEFEGADLKTVADKAARSIIIDEQRKMRAALENGETPTPYTVNVADLGTGATSKVMTIEDVKTMLRKMDPERRREAIEEALANVDEVDVEPEDDE